MFEVARIKFRKWVRLSVGLVGFGIVLWGLYHGYYTYQEAQPAYQLGVIGRQGLKESVKINLLMIFAGFGVMLASTKV